VAVARRDALQRGDHEAEPARRIEVVGTTVQPVDEVVTKRLEPATVAGEVSQSPNGAVAVVVTGELGCRVGQVLNRRHVTSASNLSSRSRITQVGKHASGACTVNVPKSAVSPNDLRKPGAEGEIRAGGPGRLRITRTRDVSHRPSSHAEGDEEAWP
jgi:hypothetical protein